MFPHTFKSTSYVKKEIRYSNQESCFWCSVKMSILSKKKSLLVSLLRSGNVSTCVGAAGKLFIDTNIYVSKQWGIAGRKQENKLQRKWLLSAY